jgi:hypothetical protein
MAPRPWKEDDDDDGLEDGDAWGAGPGETWMHPRCEADLFTRDAMSDELEDGHRRRMAEALAHEYDLAVTRALMAREWEKIRLSLAKQAAHQHYEERRL